MTDERLAKATRVEHYLGDGLYASFNGFLITLRAPREGTDHLVHLEPDVLAEFERWVAHIRKGSQP